MISVLTLTYQRYHILEEAIESFLRQDYSGPSEMVVVNDCPDVDYVFDHPKVKIINLKTRISSIGKKLEVGYKLCQFDYIYRLDDDDLLAPWAIRNTVEDISNNPGYDVYRSNGHYFFSNNEYFQVQDNINNGNVYSRAFLDSITFPEKSGDEDVDITFHKGAKIFNSNRLQKSMIYRWGMGTYHISGWGKMEASTILRNTDNLVKTISDNENRHIESGCIKLVPKFSKDYYSFIV